MPPARLLGERFMHVADATPISIVSASKRRGLPMARSARTPAPAVARPTGDRDDDLPCAHLPRCRALAHPGDGAIRQRRLRLRAAPPGRLGTHPQRPLAPARAGGRPHRDDPRSQGRDRGAGLAPRQPTCLRRLPPGGGRSADRAGGSHALGQVLRAADRAPRRAVPPCDSHPGSGWRGAGHELDDRAGYRPPPPALRFRRAGLRPGSPFPGESEQRWIRPPAHRYPDHRAVYPRQARRGPGCGTAGCAGDSGDWPRQDHAASPRRGGRVAHQHRTGVWVRARI